MTARHQCVQGARLLKIERDIEAHRALVRERAEVSNTRAAGYSRELARIYTELAKIARRLDAVGKAMGL